MSTQVYSHASGPSLTVEHVRTGILWLMFASSFVVTIEPAPSDLLFFAMVPFFLVSGLSMGSAAWLLALLLASYNLGGLLSYLPVADKPRTGLFVATSIYMALTAVFFCLLLKRSTASRYRAIVNGWITGAVIASIMGIVGAMDFAGLGEAFSMQGRARGLFKDPNVFSTYLIFPMVFLVQSVMLRTTKHLAFSCAALLLILAALFLAFSRGAWINGIGAIALLVATTFLLAEKGALRLRIFVFSVAGAVSTLLIIAILLSIPTVRDLFIERFSFNQSYDVGETGRFGNQLNSISVLLGRPLGFGPLQFSSYYNQDPHNTFLNAFSSYGWLGGISYIALIVLTLVAGFRTVIRKSTVQAAAIAIYCPLVTTIFQGIQIDTDHWRHFYWLVGMMWGLFAVSISSQSADSGLPTNVEPPKENFQK